MNEKPQAHTNNWIQLLPGLETTKKLDVCALRAVRSGQMLSNSSGSKRQE